MPARQLEVVEMSDIEPGSRCAARFDRGQQVDELLFQRRARPRVHAARISAPPNENAGTEMGRMRPSRCPRAQPVVETGVDPVTPRFSGVCSAD